MSKKEDSVRRPAKGPRIALAQIAPALGDTAANLERHRAAVKRAVEDGCDLLVFPELSLSGYNLKDLVSDVAVTRGDATWKELESLSSDVAFVIGLVEETADHHFYNAAAYFEAGRCVALHRKTYLPTYGMFDEQRYFARGGHIAAFDTKCGRVAMLVCEDMLHPSALTVAACDGATLIVVPSASPARGVTEEGEADSNARSWEAYLAVMARAFGVWVAYCNRVGVEDGVSFWGGSEILTPAGERALKGAYYEEDFLSAVLSDDAVRRRRLVNPLVRDEDLDLTINELARIRGRAQDKVESKESAPAPRRDYNAPSRRDENAPSRRDENAPPRDFDGPPRRPAPRFDRDDRGGRDGDGPPKRFDRGGPPPRRFDNDRGGRPDEGFRPRGGYQQRGGFDRPRFQSDDRDRPRFGGPPRGREDGPPRGRDDGPPRGGGFGPPRGGGNFRPPRDGGFGPPRGGGFGPPRDDRDGPPRGRDDGPPRGGGFGPPRGGGGFGPPRGGGFGKAPRDREDGGTFGGGKGSFGGPSRERQRPEPTRKPFHKGAKPRGRGRKDD